MFIIGEIENVDEPVDEQLLVCVIDTRKVCIHSENILITCLSRKFENAQLTWVDTCL